MGDIVINQVEGTEPGYVCNRDGCLGIIQEKEKTGDGCSCHINPPCSYCMEDPGVFCAVCDWESD